MLMAWCFRIREATAPMLTNIWLHNHTFMVVNTLRPRQNGRRFADDTFECIFLNENVWILIKISLKFVPKGPINNNPALVQMMAWRQSGNKPLSEPMMVCLLIHICVTRPQWVNGLTHWDQEHNGQPFIENIFKLLLLDENHCIFWFKINCSLFLRLKWIIIQHEHLFGWCTKQVPSHYLKKCLSRYLMMYGITRLQWIKSASCKCGHFVMV